MHIKFTSFGTYYIFYTKEEEVLFIYSFPLIYWSSSMWRKKVMDRVQLDY